MFGSKIKRLRKSLSLSQSALAEIVGTSQAVISNYEADLYNVSKVIMEKLKQLTIEYDLKINWKK